MVKKLAFIILFQIALSSTAFSANCKYLAETCSPNAKCYNHRLMMSCNDGRTGFVDDQNVPDTILGVANTKKLKLIDIIDNVSTEMIFSFPIELIVYNESFGEFSLKINDSKKSKYNCMWTENPIITQGRCVDAKPICSGKVRCVDKATGISIGGLSSCLATTAGANCQSASACASSQDSLELIKSACTMTGVDENGNPIANPHKSSKLKNSGSANTGK